MNQKQRIGTLSEGSPGERAVVFSPWRRDGKCKAGTVVVPGPRLEPAAPLWCPRQTALPSAEAGRGPTECLLVVLSDLKKERV